MTEAEKTALRARRAYFHTGLPTYSVSLPAALNVLDAIGNPVTDNDVLGAGFCAAGNFYHCDHADRLYRLIRRRIEPLGLVTGYRFSEGLEAMIQAVKDRNPVQGCERPPRAPLTGLVSGDEAWELLESQLAWARDCQPAIPSRPMYHEL